MKKDIHTYTFMWGVLNGLSFDIQIMASDKDYYTHHIMLTAA